MSCGRFLRNGLKSNCISCLQAVWRKGSPQKIDAMFVGSLIYRVMQMRDTAQARLDTILDPLLLALWFDGGYAPDNENQFGPLLDGCVNRYWF